MSSANPIDQLRKACVTNLGTNASLSDDGKTLTLFGSSHDAATPHTFTLNDGKGGTKEVTYTLASIYLQLLNPSVLQYRKACESANVDNPVAVLDKGQMSLYFFDDEADNNEKADDAMDMSDDDADKREAVKFSRDEKKRNSSSRKEKDRKSRSGRDKDRRSSSDKHRSKSKSRKSGGDDDDDRRKSKGSKVPKAPITNEQLVANLSTIVDKRDLGSNSAPTKDKEGEEAGEDGVATDSNTAVAAGDSSSQLASPSAAGTPGVTDDEGMAKEDDEKKEKEDRELLLKWLSPEGFTVSDAAIEADREAVRRITALEIPVGDSASILRAGAGGEIVVDKGNEVTSAASPGGDVKKRDFARVLELYHEVVVAEERAKRSSSTSSSSGKKRPPPPSSSSRGNSKSPRTSSGSGSASKPTVTKMEGNPIIVVPNAMTSVITMINAGFFLGKDATFVPREQAIRDPKAGKRGGTISITRKLHPRLGGGGEITYDIIDNPTTRLKKDEWNRVVAVICQGASWQFKGWRYSDPVDLFSKTFGFYVGLEGSAVPSELRGWNVKTGKISRDRRGLDNICLASFWNGLEEFLAVKKGFFVNNK